MAQLTTHSETHNSNRRTAAIPGVDLTAMVDLAFLLITFFMLTTSLKEQNAMKIAMPALTHPGDVADNRAFTICLGANNKALTYRGTSDNPVFTSVTNVAQIRRILVSTINDIKMKTGKASIVLIKPSDKCNFKNLVDVLDEMQINKVSSYAIVDIVKPDLNLLKNDKAY